MASILHTLIAKVLNKTRKEVIEVKKKIAVLAVLAFFMSVSFGMAMPYVAVMDDNGIQNGTAGGPFKVIEVSATQFPDLLYTFCIETGEFLSLGGYYYASIEDTVMYSTGGGLTVLAPETEKLYSYFLDNIAALTAAEKDQIQLAIWDYQNQVGYNGTQGGNTFFVNAPSYTKTHEVQALNLWTADVQSDRTKAQSLLIATGDPVPEPGMLLLLGLGLIGVAGLRRKM